MNSDPISSDLKAFYRICLMSLVVLGTACAHKSSVLGFWQLEDTPRFFDFQEGGILVSYASTPTTNHARYSLLANSKLTIQVAGASDARTFNVSIKGEQMILTGTNGTMILHRADPSMFRPDPVHGDTFHPVPGWLTNRVILQEPKI